MRPMRGFTALAIVCGALLAAGCGGITDPSKNTVENISGTLAVGGLNAHGFTSSKTGELSVKITALAPTSNAVLGLTWTQAANDGTCAGALQQTFAQLNIPAIAGPVSSQKYCIIVQDVGSISVPQTYTLAISHP
jgi:hypothetical protein